MYLSLKGSLGHTAITDRVGESLLQIAEGSSAAYSLRNLGSDSPSVVRVRRESDNAERDFSAQDINTSVVENWVNQQIIPPLDLRELTPTGRDGPLIPAAAAYSLRNLSNSYTGNVVKVRRNSDDAEADFTAVEVSDGTLLAWVLGSASGFIGNRMYLGAGNSGEYVRLSTIGNLGNQDWQWKFKFFLTDEDQFRGLMSLTAFNPVVAVEGNGSLSYYYKDIGGNSTSASLLPNNSVKRFVEYTLTLSYDLSEKTTSVTLVDSDGTSLNGSLSNVYHSDGVAGLDIGTNSNSQYSLGGSIYDVEISQSGVLTNSYQGYGNTSADWEDTTGNNNGTVNGSPELFTGQGFDGHVSTWYDQSGNTNHATQATPASQPKVVDAGILVAGGINFDGAQKLEKLFPSGFSGKEQSYFVKFTPNSNLGYLVELGGGIGAARSLSVEPYLRFNAVTQDYDSTILSGDSLLSLVCPDAPTTIDGYDLYYQGSLLTPDSLSGGTLANVTSSDITIGDGAYIGKISEAILYNSDQSDNRTAFEANIGEVYGIAGIPAYDNTVNGFVETWYDQSGNGNNASQLTASQQPKIVDAGVLVTDRDGKVALNGKGAKLDLPNDIPMLSADGTYSLFAVVDFDDQRNGNDEFNNILRFDSKTFGGASSLRKPLIFLNQNNGTLSSTGPSYPLGGVIYTVAETLSVQLLTNIANPALLTGNDTLYADGVLVSSSDLATDVNTETRLQIDSQIFDNQETTVTHFLSEVIYYPSDESANRPAIEDNIDNHYGITPAFSAEATNYFSRLDAAGDTTYVDYKQPLANYIDSLVSLGGAYWDDMLTSASFVGVGIQGITVPLRDGMTALTNNNFVAGDLNQLIGLKGDGSTKYLDTGYIDSDLAQNNGSLSVYVDTPSSINGTFYAGTTSAGNTGTFLRRRVTNPQLNVHGFLVDVGTAIIDGLVGVSRTSSTSVNARTNQTNYSFTDTSTTPTSDALQIFARQSTSISDPRLATYHAGPALDLATLEGLQETLLAEIAGIGFSTEAANYFSRLAIAGDTTFLAYRQPLANYIDSLVALGGAYWDDMKSAASFVGVGIQGVTVPLRDGMTVPTNNNFVAGDLDQLTGLKGDGTTKFISTGLNTTDFAQDDVSLSTYITTPNTVYPSYFAGAFSGSDQFALFSQSSSSRALVFSAISSIAVIAGVGLIGASRSDSANQQRRVNQTEFPEATVSRTPVSSSLDIFATSGLQPSDARLATYHAGTAITLSTLESLQATLISEIAAI